MPLPAFRPQPLVRIPQPFNDPACLRELKLDGYRAIAYIEDRECRLVSRNGHTYPLPPAADRGRFLSCRATATPTQCRSAP